MRAQRRGHWCGIASIANALEVLGIRRTQREIAKLCDVRPEVGTNEVEMKRALLANGMAVDEWPDPEPGIACLADDARCSAQAVGWVFDCVRLGWPVILCVDDDEHWVTVIGLCGDRLVLFDPSRNTGIEIHTEASLAARWVNSDGIYYGIGVSQT